MAALVAAVGQVALGGVVRVTDSGLGCPDWPLCHGEIVPPLEVHTLIEYSHRLSATLLGLLVVAGAAVAWRTRRGNPLALAAMGVALVLVMVAAALGGVTVVTELAWWVVLLHLALAETVVACLAVASVAGWRAAPLERSGAAGIAESGRYQMLLVITLMGTFGLMLSGSYMVGLGYGSSCATWPLCNGSVLPQGEAYMVHMTHRYAAGAVGALTAMVALSAWRRRPSSPVGWAATALLGLFLVQAALGAATVWTGFAAGLKSIHLVVATLVWVALVYLAALSFPVRGIELRRLSKGPEPLAGLEGSTP